MDKLFPLPSAPAGLSLSARGLYLAVTPTRETDRVTELIAGLALRGPLAIVAGSEWIPNYAVARLLRRSTPRLESILGHIHLARAFTCYQLLDLLSGARPESAPLLVLDMLHTFYSDDIPLDVRRRTLERCGRHLQRLSLYRPVAVLTPRAASQDFPRFYSMLASLADEIYQPETARPAAMQPDLF